MENLLKIEQLEKFYASNNVGIFCYLTNKQELAELIDSGAGFPELENYIYQGEIYIGIIDEISMKYGKLTYTSGIVEDIDEDRNEYYCEFSYAFPLDLTMVSLLK